MAALEGLVSFVGLVGVLGVVVVVVVVMGLRPQSALTSLLTMMAERA